MNIREGRIEEIENWTGDAVKEIINELGQRLGKFNELDNDLMNLIKTAFRTEANGKLLDTVTCIHGNSVFVDKNHKVDLQKFGFKGEEKMMLEAIINEKFIEYKKSRTANLKTNVTAHEWFNSLRSISEIIAKEDILPYVEAVAKQVYNAQLAAGIVSGNPFQEILYLKSEMQGNGKSTLMNKFKDGAVKAGLEASAASWPELGYHDMTPFMTNHMTFIDDSMQKEKNIDIAELGAIGRRSMVTTKEKYKSDVKAPAQGFIMAAGNREPYNSGDRCWRTIKVMPIEYKDILSVLQKSDNLTDNFEAIFCMDPDLVYQIYQIISKTIINENNNNKRFLESDNDKLIKIIGTNYIELIQRAGYEGLDLSRFTVKKLVDHYKSTSNEIYTQTASNIATNLNKASNKNLGLIERISRNGDPTKSVYDLSFISQIDLSNIGCISNSDFDVIMEAQAEWDRVEQLLFGKSDPDNTDNNNTNSIVTDNTPNSEAKKMTFDLHQDTVNSIVEDITSSITSSNSNIDEVDKMTNNELLSIANALSEAPKHIKITYTYEDGHHSTLYKSVEEFEQSELNLLRETERQFAKIYLERGYERVVKPNDLGIVKLRFTYCDKPNDASIIDGAPTEDKTIQIKQDDLWDDLSIDEHIQELVDLDPNTDVDKALCTLFNKGLITKVQLLERL